MNPGSPGDTGDEWITIKVAAAFSVLRFLPWWLGTASDTANPVLEIGPHGLRYRVLRLREVDFVQIDEVDLRTAWRTVNLCFRFRDPVATFSANVRHLDEAARALRLMEGRAPFSHRAQDLVALRAAGNPVGD